MSIEPNSRGFVRLPIISTLLNNRYLLGQLIKRDVLLRYRGAYFGLFWIFLTPLFMLTILAFVFSQILQARWAVDVGTVPYALKLYCGLIAFNIFSETVVRSPVAVRGYPVYVKKIIFPVEILPLVSLGSALIHGLFNLFVLAAALVWTGHMPAYLLLSPLLLLPLVMLAMGLAWFLAAWGVFIKDMSQIVPIAVQMLMFLSPVFYPAEAVPESLRPIFALNPLCPVIAAMRASLVGSPIDWNSWYIAFFLGLGVLILGYGFFMRSREEFADVL